MQHKEDDFCIQQRSFFLFPLKSIMIVIRHVGCLIGSIVYPREMPQLVILSNLASIDKRLAEIINVSFKVSDE